MEQKFDFVEVTLDQDNYEKVKEVYRLHKEQARKIFDLSNGVWSDEDILDYVKGKVEDGIVLLAYDKEQDRYAGVILFDNIHVLKEEIPCMGVHIVVSKKYWGKDSRTIIFDCYKYLKENMKPIKRLEAFVPANNFGIIKLLKDVGFKIEGTLKNRVMYSNREGKPTYYNELVYSNLKLGEEKNE